MDYAQRRKLQGKETERRILNAALDLMRDRGFDKVSIRDICKEAGITTGAFYHHFSSKEALLESGFAPLDDYMAGALAGHEEEPPDLRLWRILSAYAKFMEQSGELIGRYYQRRIAEPGTRSMDATRYTLRAMLDCFRQAEGEDYVPVDFAVVAAGVVRGSFAAGEITVSDAFQVSSLGSGGDGTPGYPLISVYITGRELRDAFEVDASVTPLMSAAQLYGAGMTWTFNPHRMLFDKVTDCAQVLEDGRTVPLEDDRLYRVVTGLYSGQMLGAVNDKSFGLLTITPKDEQGVPVTDFEARILHNADGTEVKEWYALASYLQSMGMVDARYAAPEGRKVVNASWNPIALLKNPGGTTIFALLLALAAVLIVILALRRLLGRRPRSGGYRNYRGRRR